MNDTKPNKSLESLQENLQDSLQSADSHTNRAVANAEPLSKQIKIERVDLAENAKMYSPKDNLAESKSFKALYS